MSQERRATVTHAKVIGSMPPSSLSGKGRRFVALLATSPPPPRSDDKMQGKSMEKNAPAEWVGRNTADHTWED